MKSTQLKNIDNFFKGYSTQRQVKPKALVEKYFI